MENDLSKKISNTLITEIFDTLLKSYKDKRIDLQEFNNKTIDKSKDFNFNLEGNLITFYLNLYEKENYIDTYSIRCEIYNFKSITEKFKSKCDLDLTILKGMNQIYYKDIKLEHNELFKNDNYKTYVKNFTETIKELLSLNEFK